MFDRPSGFEGAGLASADDATADVRVMSFNVRYATAPDGDNHWDRRKGLLMKQGLAAIADEFPEVIESIRGAGLMLGLKCKAPNAKVMTALRDRKLLSVTAGDNVVRLLPPLTVSEAEIREALARIRAGVKSLAPAAAAAAT